MGMEQAEFATIVTAYIKPLCEGTGIEEWQAKVIVDAAIEGVWARREHFPGDLLAHVVDAAMRAAAKAIKVTPSSRFYYDGPWIIDRCHRRLKP